MVLVLVEHREGEIRDITFEMLGKAAELAEEIDSKVSAVLLTHDSDGFVDQLKPWAHEIFVAEDPKYEKFNSDVYQQAFVDFVKEKEPELTMIGHSSQGMDLAPPWRANWKYHWLQASSTSGGRIANWLLNVKSTAAR